MNTQLKSIRFPKKVVETLDEYSKIRYGTSFSKLIVHMAIEKVDEINKEHISNLVNDYQEIENAIENGEAKTYDTEEDVQDLLDSWK